MFEKSKILEFLRGFANIWNILRFVLILICFVWFCINATQIVKKYMEYNTIVMIEYKQPNETDLPAFTICAYSIVNDKDLEQEYWNLIEYTNFDNISLDEKYARRQMLREKAFQSKTVFNIFNESSITFGSIVEQCTFYPNAKYNRSDAYPCAEITEIVESINQGQKCFTIFSQLNITNSKIKMKLEYEMNPYIEIVLTSKSLQTNSSDYLLNETSSFTLHSPNIIPTGLDYKYYSIYEDQNIYYDIRFTKQIAYLKLPPYKTMCREYRDNNQPGQRSRGDCLNRCISQKTFENNCFSFFSVVTRDLIKEKSKAKICSQRQSKYGKYAFARRQCMEDCPLSCYEENIEIGYADYYVNYEPQKVILIRSDATPYTIVYHEESMGEPELMGNLGGHAHIWLGLSALKIFNWIVHLVNRIKRVFCK